jgi:hypothetical protein
VSLPCSSSYPTRCPPSPHPLPPCPLPPPRSLSPCETLTRANSLGLCRGLSRHTLVRRCALLDVKFFVPAGSRDDRAEPYAGQGRTLSPLSTSRSICSMSTLNLVFTLFLSFHLVRTNKMNLHHPPIPTSLRIRKKAAMANRC